jgi:hypothetical protein
MLKGKRKRLSSIQEVTNEADDSTSEDQKWQNIDN